MGWGGPDPVFALPSMTIPRPELLKCLSRIPFSFPITYPVPIFAGESRFPRKRSNTVFHQKQFWVFPNPAKYLGLKSSPDPANTLSESVHCLSWRKVQFFAIEEPNLVPRPLVYEADGTFGFFNKRSWYDIM